MGFISSFFGAEGSNNAANTYANAADEWKNFEVPSPEEMARKAKQLYDTGYLTPEQYQAALQDPSSLEKYTGDPRLREAQMRSLDYLTNVGTQGGMTAEDRAQLNAIQNKNAITSKGARDANLYRMKARGLGGSGLEAMSNMIADQGAASDNYMGGTQVAANAEKRALDAMTGAGTMAGNIRGQEFGEAQKKAAAADEIKRFNAANQTQANATNVAARNAARNAALNLQDEDWQKKKQRLTNQTNLEVGQAPYQERAGQQLGEGVGGAVSTIPTIASMFMASDEKVKEDVAPAKPDIEAFLAELKPKKWDYKDPAKYGEGKQVGVMAQDMEKSPVGRQFVSKDAEGVKRIDYGKAQGTMLAILKTLADRVDELEGAHA